MQKRCAVRLRCTKSDIFSHLLQPQTIPAHKNYCHVPKIEDAPISRVKPLARLREARLQIRRQKRDSNSFRTTDGKKPLTARSVRQNRTDTGSTVPTPELISGSERCWYWYIGWWSHISYQTLLTQICNECFTALFFLRTCIMCYSYYCYSLNWVMFCSGLILIISNQAEQYNSYLEPTYICSKNKSLGVEVEKNQRRNVTIILRFFTWVFSSSGTLCFHFSTFSYLLI